MSNKGLIDLIVVIRCKGFSNEDEIRDFVYSITKNRSQNIEYVIRTIVEVLSSIEKFTGSLFEVFREKNIKKKTVITVQDISEEVLIRELELENKKKLEE